jgi:hypothetical protein
MFACQHANNACQHAKNACQHAFFSQHACQIKIACQHAKIACQHAKIAFQHVFFVQHKRPRKIACQHAAPFPDVSLNGGALSWRSSRQGGVTLSSAEAEFVAASQAGQEAIYLRALLRGFNFRQVIATEIWEDDASCIMMSENPANRERTRHVDTRVHYLRELVSR